MVRVITKITNSDDSAGSHSIPAQFRAQILEEKESEADIAEAIFVNSREIAEKVIARFHFERDYKKSPIFLAQALELVMADETAEVRNEIAVISSLLAVHAYDKLRSSVYAAYTEAVEAEKILIDALNKSSLSSEIRDSRLRQATKIKETALKMVVDIRLLIDDLRKVNQTQFETEEKGEREDELHH